MNKKTSILLGIFIIILLLFIICHFITLSNKCENEIDNFNVISEIPLQLTKKEEEEIIKKNEEELKNIQKDYVEVERSIKKQAEIYNKNFLESVKKMEQQLNEFDNTVERSEKENIIDKNLVKELEKKEQSNRVFEENQQINIIENLFKKTNLELDRQEKLRENIEKKNQEIYQNNLQKEVKVYQKAIEMEEKQKEIEFLVEKNRYESEELLIKQETKVKINEIKELNNIVNELTKQEENNRTKNIKIEKNAAVNQLTELVNNLL